MECQPKVILSCEDGSVVFGPKTGQKIHLHLRAGEIVRLDAFTLTQPITISLVDKNPGSDCADCGTGSVMPYAPCGVAKELNSLNKVQYIKGPGVFELLSAAPSGVPYVKLTKVNSVSDTEFCLNVLPPEPPCEDTTWMPTGLERCVGSDVLREEVSNCGTVRWTVDRPQTWQPTGDERCTGANVERKETNNCNEVRWVVSRPQTWQQTGETRCVNNVIENKEINDCGTTRWTATATVCGYCPSMRISCSGEGGYGYHINDPKDPAATVEMAPCAGDTTVDSIWIYPSSGPGHTVKVTDCDGVLIGYAANKSDCASDCGC